MQLDDVTAVGDFIAFAVLPIPMNNVLARRTPHLPLADVHAADQIAQQIVDRHDDVAVFAKKIGDVGGAFGADALWAFKATREGNTVVMAQRTPSRPKRAELMARAEVVQERWGLPATKWLRVFKPVVA